jgi:hypothetical protein
MTKEEWLSTLDPQAVLQQLRESHGKSISARKWRLASVALSCSTWELLTDERSRAAVEAAELYADKALRASADTFAIEQAASEVVDLLRVQGESRSNDAANAAACCLALWATADYGTFVALQGTLESVGRERQLQILDCVFGIPLHERPADPSWRTTTAVAIAKGMYDSRDFAAMPLLADALEDAGCADASILDHCRGPGPHVKGCWVVDLVLGKE